jgi:hypothetical protein
MTTAMHKLMFVCYLTIQVNSPACFTRRQTIVNTSNYTGMYYAAITSAMTGGVGFNPEPQVIAEAIAVYQYNKKKWQTGGLPTLDTMTIPCITMVGMQPMFYLIPVTQALSTAVVTGQYPKTPTKVVKCVTASGPNRPFSEGMMMPEYRRVAFQHFITFKILAKEYWQAFLV